MKAREIEREDRKRALPSTGLLCQMLATAGAEPGLNQEPRTPSSSPKWAAEKQGLELSSAASQAVQKNEAGTGSAAKIQIQAEQG